MTHFAVSYIAGVASRNLAACAVVLEYAVGVEALREGYGGYFAVGGHADSKCGAVQRAGKLMPALRHGEVNVYCLHRKSV